MTKSELTARLHEMIEEHLFGGGPWLRDSEASTHSTSSLWSGA